MELKTFLYKIESYFNSKAYHFVAFKLFPHSLGEIKETIKLFSKKYTIERRKTLLN